MNRSKDDRWSADGSGEKTYRRWYTDGVHSIDIRVDGLADLSGNVDAKVHSFNSGRLE